jgi:transposase InsO family protein
VAIILVTASFVFKRRNQMPTTIQDLITRFETETEETIVIFRSNNGGEFMSKDLIQWLTKRGIIHQTSTPKTPEQNGVAERYNRTILESMKSYMNVMKSC